MSATTELLIQGFSAFAGAFFAFVFLRITEFLSKIYERQVRHYNSLVVLETQLNELIGIISDDLYLIPTFKNSIESGNIYFSKLSQLPIDKTHYDNLQDITLINDLFSYNSQLRKLNDDIDSLSGGYADIKNAYIQRNIDPNDYLLNAKITAKMLTTLQVFLDDTNKKTIELMAKVRLMSKRDVPLGTQMMRWFIKTSGDEVSNTDIKAETKKLIKEVKQTQSRSKKEIDKIIKNQK